MTYTTTTTTTYTRTHTANQLADVILGSIADILGTLGIDPTQLFGDWEIDQKAIAAWIAEGALKSVALECHHPGGTVDPILEFPVSYRVSGEGDRQFTADRAAFARYLAKLKTVPRGTVYKLFCSYRAPPSSQPGWGPGNRASTQGMHSYSFGTLASGPHAAAYLKYYAK